MNKVIDLMKFKAEKEAEEAELMELRVFLSRENDFGHPLIVVRYEGLLYLFEKTKVKDLNMLMDAFATTRFAKTILSSPDSPDFFFGELEDITDTWTRGDDGK